MLYKEDAPKQDATMATTTGADDISIHQENDDHDDHDNNTVENTTDTTGNINLMPTGGSGTGGTASSEVGTTNFNLQVELNKIQEFFRTKSKDTISAMNFIRKLEDLAKTNQ